MPALYAYLIPYYKNTRANDSDIAFSKENTVLWGMIALVTFAFP